ncbi:MAG: hypothetical protein V7703_18410 [Hyphomicrobiales bacterium]
MTFKRNPLVVAAGLAVGMMVSTGTASADTFGPMDTSGFVEIFGAHSFLTNVGPDADDDRYTGGGGGGQVNFWLNDSYTVQIDGDFDFFRNDPDDDTEFAIEMLVHAGWRDPERGYFGGFGGFVTNGYVGDSDDPAQWVAGGEGAIYLDMMTVFAQAGFMDQLTSAEDEAFTDAFFVRGGVRYFVNPNLKLEASGGLLSGDEYTDTPLIYHFGVLKWNISRRIAGSAGSRHILVATRTKKTMNTPHIR